MIVKSSGQPDWAEETKKAEEARLATLSRYEILDTPLEAAFDRITQLASTLFDVPVVLISLVDKDRQWFKSCYGLDMRETDRSLSFCAHAIQADTVLVVPDATKDARFARNALVTGEPGIRFYAGAPLATPDGYKLGTLCLIDREPRKQLSYEQRAMLESLAALVVDELELRRVGRALQASEGKLRVIVEGTPDALYIKDTEGRFAFINLAGAKMLGYSVASLLGKRNRDLFNSEDSARITADDQRVMALGKTLSYEQALQLGGKEHIFLTNKLPYRSEQGELLGLVGINQDITERRRAEQALTESEARYRAIVEQATVGVSQTDLTGRFLYVNDRYCEIVGRAREELLGGLRLHDVTAPEDLPQNLQAFEQLLVDDVPFSIEKRYQRPDGTRVWVSLEVSLVRNLDGKSLYAQAIVQDIDERKRTERALSESEARYRIVAETASDVLITIDQENTILYLNQAAEKVFGHPLTDMLGRDLNMLMPEYLRHVHAAGLKRYHETGQRHISWEAVEVPGLHKDGHEIDLEISFGEYKQQGHHLFTAIIRDITERKRASEVHKRAAALLQATFDSTAEGVLSVDERGRVTGCNRRYLEMWSVPAALIAIHDDEALVQHALKQLKKPEAFLARTQATYSLPEGETRDELELRDGRVIERVSLPQRIEDRIVGRVWSFRDVTARYRSEERLQEANRELEVRVVERTAALENANRELTRLNSRLAHDAFHDSLTGLPNRALFTDRLHQAIERYNVRVDYGFSVLFLDFDRFKNVNDSLGHTVGDKLLIGVAERLSHCVRPRDTVARLGGDEFTILLEDVTGIEQATSTAERIQHKLSKPFILDGQTVHTSASIGITSSAFNYEGPGDALRDADVAMYRAKALGKATFQVFTPEMGARAASLLTLENDLRRAIERQELRVHYQPVIAVASGQLIGVEALLRWQHPHLGMVSRAEFMPVAEETGLIVEFDRWVLREACRQLRVWQNVVPLALNVNLSGKAFTHAGLVESVGTSLLDVGFSPGNLRLELTESVLVQSSEETLATLAKLKALGVQLYIDDFGTGYSSLSYLQRLPIDALKIDSSFVQRMTLNPESSELVKTILVMARNLGLEVVAEGVENVRQLRRLKRSGCPYAQGYLFSKPLSAEEMTAYLEKQVIGR